MALKITGNVMFCCCCCQGYLKMFSFQNSFVTDDTKSKILSKWPSKMSRTLLILRGLWCHFRIVDLGLHEAESHHLFWIRKCYACSLYVWWYRRRNFYWHSHRWAAANSNFFRIFTFLLQNSCEFCSYLQY